MGYGSNILFMMPKIDVDALAFLTATGITDAVQRNAIDTLVKALKSYGIWSNLHAFYPFIGGTATTHKYNLINPLDTDAAFRLTFAGTITHDANGVSFSVTNGWANTHYIPSVDVTLNNESFGFYSRTSTASAVGGLDMGTAVSTTQRDELNARTNLDKQGCSINSVTATKGNISVANTDALGFYVASRTNSATLVFYKNGSSQGSALVTNDGTRSNIKMYLGCRNVTNVAQGFTGRNFGMAYLGLGLSSTQNANLYTAVQVFQTTLGRQV